MILSMRQTADWASRWSVQFAGVHLICLLLVIAAYFRLLHESSHLPIDEIISSAALAGLFGISALLGLGFYAIEQARSKRPRGDPCS
jgi:hypothetical protein